MAKKTSAPFAWRLYPQRPRVCAPVYAPVQARVSRVLHCAHAGAQRTPSLPLVPGVFAAFHRGFHSDSLRVHALPHHGRRQRHVLAKSSWRNPSKNGQLCGIDPKTSGPGSAASYTCSKPLGLRQPAALLKTLEASLPDCVWSLPDGRIIGNDDRRGPERYRAGAI